MDLLFGLDMSFYHVSHVANFKADTLAKGSVTFDDTMFGILVLVFISLLMMASCHLRYWSPLYLPLVSSVILFPHFSFLTKISRHPS